MDVSIEQERYWFFGLLIGDICVIVIHLKEEIEFSFQSKGYDKDSQCPEFELIVHLELQIFLLKHGWIKQLKNFRKLFFLNLLFP